MADEEWKRKNMLFPFGTSCSSVAQARTNLGLGVAWTWHSVEAKGDLNWLNATVNRPKRRCRIVNVIGKPPKRKAE
ncbi:hypothetical protein [Sinorhizobium fredii]|uniref:hypothetical protein n=1 Tax=Rhizobium fredii TaxID=380 RepID=UPI0035166076